MDKIRIGLLTIGQSPRRDLVPEIKPLLSPNLEIIEWGLLDELDAEEIERLKPKRDEIPLVSRLKDGREIQLSEAKISQLLPKAIQTMKNEMDVSAIGVLCTHDFPKGNFPCPTIFPSDYLRFLIDEILEVKSLGVVVPLITQLDIAKKKWGKERTSLEVKPPYAEGKSWEEVAKTFFQEDVKAIVLDCIGYKVKDRREIQRFLHVPTLLPRAVLAYAINQIFNDDYV